MIMVLSEFLNGCLLWYFSINFMLLQRNYSLVLKIFTKTILITLSSVESKFSSVNKLTLATCRKKQPKCIHHSRLYEDKVL
jgi:hypothetical protein